MEKKVTVNATTMVRPYHLALVSNQKRIVLSAFSHMLWFVGYMARYLFFKCPDGQRFETIVENLKAALAKTLLEFYPLAGRLEVRDGLIEVVCNGEGVLFIEAASEVSMEELETLESDGHFQGVSPDLLHDLAQCFNYNLVYPWEDAPLLLIQATIFSCGGVCISFRFNHQLIDGDTLWHFVKSLSEVSCGKSLSVPAVVMDTPPSIAVSTTIAMSPPVTHADSKPKLYDFKLHCFVFNKKMIQKLKAEHPGYSTFQLLTAYIWRKVTEARNLPLDQVTRLYFAVNCRGKIDSLPRGYVGEASLVASVGSTAGELTQLVGGAALVREKIAQVNDEFVSFYCKNIGPGSSGKNTVIPPMAVGKDVNVGESFHFPVFHDFGFGAPVGMTVDTHLGNGNVLYFPTRELGEVAAYVSLKPDVMERLVADSTFMNP